MQDKLSRHLWSVRIRLALSYACKMPVHMNVGMEPETRNINVILSAQSQVAHRPCWSRPGPLECYDKHKAGPSVSGLERLVALHQSAGLGLKPLALPACRAS